MKHLIFFGIILTILFGNAHAQTLNAQKLDSLFEKLESKDKFMGSIAILENGKMLYSKVIGFVDVETEKHSNLETKYRIGSISKMFTSCLVFKAIEENKLSLNQTINKFFPTIKHAEKITIENLLNHRSGIHNFTNDSDYLQYNTTIKSEPEMVAIIQNGKSNFEPNTKAEYSNSNYVLLSFILQKLYNKPYKELLAAKIIKPLGLKHTYFGSKISIASNECNSYSYIEKWEKETETDMSIPMGAGAVVSNPTDLVNFIETLFKGKIINEASLEKMKTIRDNYGMGIFQVPFRDKKGYGHTGGIDGFHAVVCYYPDSKLSVALTSNGMVYESNNILIAALSSYFGYPFTIPTFESVKLESGELDKYIGVYSSPDFPLAITITKDGNKLFAQASGQSAFPLDATGKDIFEFAPAGIKLEFKPTEKQMILMQGGRKFVLTKK